MPVPSNYLISSEDGKTHPLSMPHQQRDVGDILNTKSLKPFSNNFSIRTLCILKKILRSSFSHSNTFPFLVSGLVRTILTSGCYIFWLNSGCWIISNTKYLLQCYFSYLGGDLHDSALNANYLYQQYVSIPVLCFHAWCDTDLVLSTQPIHCLNCWALRVCYCHAMTVSEYISEFLFSI